MKKFLKKILIIRRIKDRLYATKYFEIIRWVINSKEDTNYTFDLTDQNLHELNKLLESIFNINYSQVEKHSDELLNFSIQQDRKFVLFRERLKNHWYPGAGIRISY